MRFSTTDVVKAGCSMGSVMFQNSSTAGASRLRLHHRLVEGLQTCQIDDHRHAYELDGIDDGDDRHGDGRVVEPRHLLEAEAGHDRVQRALLVLEDEVVHRTHDDRGHKCGKVDDGAEHVAPADLRVQQQRQTEAEDLLDAVDPTP